MEKLYIMGFGCGDRGNITLKTIDTLKKCDRVFARTMVHPSSVILEEYSIPFISFDALYETSEDFESLYESICAEILECPEKTVGYIVPGSAVMAEAAVMKLLERAKCEVEIIPSVSFIDGLFACLKKDAADSFKLLDALQLDKQIPDVHCLNIICQIYDKQVAFDAKIALEEYYPDNTLVYLVNSAGTPQERIEMMPLGKIDRATGIDHLTTLIIPPQSALASPSDFHSFEEIIKTLRSKEGCPWDREQTHESLTSYIIEEAYEVVDAIEKGDLKGLCEELGDVLLQIVLHAQIALEEDEFTMGEIIKGVSEKMIRRHPHVFSQTDLPEDLLVQWDEIKKQEHSPMSIAEEMQQVPKCFPALKYAQKLQKKAAGVGFDFEGAKQAFEKMLSEIKELHEAVEGQNTAEIEEEAGDVLFSAVNALRLYGVDCEQALRKSAVKFLNRFEKMEKYIEQDKLTLGQIPIEVLEGYWERAKKTI